MLALSFVRTDVATNVMFWSDWVFLALFTLEMLLKMLGLGLRGFQAVVWNRFDMFLVLGSILLQALFAASASPLRIVHVTRMAKVVHAVRALRSYVLVAAGLRASCRCCKALSRTPPRACSTTTQASACVYCRAPADRRQVFHASAACTA